MHLFVLRFIHSPKHPQGLHCHGNQPLDSITERGPFPTWCEPRLGAELARVHVHRVVVFRAPVNVARVEQPAPGLKQNGHVSKLATL